MSTYLPSVSNGRINPPEPPSTGACSECSEDLTERVFEYTHWPETARVVCAWCAQTLLVTRLQQAQSDGDEDVLSIAQSLDEIAACQDCQRFECRCE